MRHKAVRRRPTPALVEAEEVVRRKDDRRRPLGDPRGASTCGFQCPSHPAQGEKTRCALIVDEDREGRTALARCLMPELEVHVAGSVNQAVFSLAELDRVDVAFVDLELPDGSGEHILERLTRWPDAIRVLVSGRALGDENRLKNRALTTLVAVKPVPVHVVMALKRATLVLGNT
jgi:CheY-like chemotaxis protein